MKLTKNLTLALVALTATAGFAQTTPTSAPATGNLGQRYVQIDASLFDPHNTSDNAYGVGASVNLPVHANVDVGFSYDYSWLKSGGTKAHDHSLAALATGYTSYLGVKPFAGVGLGYEWTKATTSGFSVRDDSSIWGLAVGVEVPVAEVTFTPNVTYTDNFKSRSNGSYHYGVEASTWVTKTLALFGEVAFTDVVGNGGQGWLYTAGVRVRF